jgi:amidase
LFSEAPETSCPKRLLVAKDAFDLAGPAATAALQPALKSLSAIVDKTQPVYVSSAGLLAWLEVFRTLQGYEVWAEHGSWVRDVKPDLGPGIRQRMQWASTITTADAEAASIKRAEIAQRMAALIQGDTVLALPTVPDIAPLLGADPQSTEDFRGRALALLCIAGIAGMPQINLPLGKLNGCPIGLSLIGARDSDMMLLAFAKTVGEVS